MADRSDQAAPSPSAQNDLPIGTYIGPGGDMSLQTSRRIWRSSSRPSPASILSRSFSAHHVPSRHGVHFPHDSWLKKRVVMWAARTMHVVLSMKITEPEPSIVPASASASKSIVMSMVSSQGALA